MIHVLSKTIHYGGAEIKELNIDLESLSTVDYQRAEKEHKTLNPGTNSVLIEAETDFIKSILIKATNLPISVIDELPIVDFARVKVKIQNFLLTGSKE